jgi:hypothetical protein
LHFCVSSVLAERLNDCLDAACKGRFCLMCWHIHADAFKRVAAGCLQPRVSSMRAKRSNCSLNSSCGGCSGLARTVQQGHVGERKAGPALDNSV